jgi:hypothetical protein
MHNWQELPAGAAGRHNWQEPPSSRDTTKLAFLTLAVLKVGIMNFSCFETGLFGVWASWHWLNWI